jgi:hypothetical protein
MRTFYVTMLITVATLTLTLAQTAPPLPPTGVSGENTQDVEEAYEAFVDAQEKRQRVSSLESAPAQNFLSQGDALLDQARADYEAGSYFVAEYRAKAAEKLYEATLELADMDGRFDDDDIEDATEELERAEAELEYYRSSDPAARELVTQARTLLENPAQAKAAEELGKAVLYLVQAERGF